ncbi:MAG: hypothetical protein E7317_01995 [Clostridiales bacterium]|nr:hypothetical protein [Clostridiales bacterium]
MLQTIFKVRGTAMRYGGSENIVIVEEEKTERPVMLQAYGDMMKYIFEQGDSDMEEKYMDIDFVYTSWCSLVAILVPSTNDRIPAKAVILSSKDHSVKIFGTQEIIDTRKPEPMSWDEWHEAFEYALNVEDINLHRFGRI